tara:strand:- start:537 stop:1754 length:1218 start_codon:yes stop_codon:yes gene_type:complete
MHGMRNGGRAALVGNPVYPQTGGREHHQENIYDSSFFTSPIVSQDVYEQKQKLKSYVPEIKNIEDLEKAYEQKLENERALTDSLAIENWAGTVPYQKTDKSGKSYTYAPGDIYKDLDYLSSDEGKKAFVRKELAEQEKKIAQAKSLGIEIEGFKVPTKAEGTTSRWDKTAPDLTASQRADLARKQQGERLKTYLDMMGYDSAKKGAMSKALIDASALVQDATTEAGSIKHADWGNLINKAIQTTSRRMEKPEQIREAVGLMMTKAELEKDVLKSKGSPQKQYAQELVDAGVYKTLAEALAAGSKKPNFRDNLLALSGKDGVSGDKINLALQSTPGEKAPTKSVKGSDKAYQKFKEKMEDAGNDSQIELEFVDKMITDKQPGDSFIIDDSLIIVRSDGTLAYRHKQ